MESLIYCVGFLVIALLVGYFLLFFCFVIIKNSTCAPFVSIDSMPALKPVPIPTRNQKTFIHKIVVSIFEVRRWELIANWHFKLEGDVEVVIPRGFQFDGASIPRPFWALLSPVGLLLIPGLVHDYGYKYDQVWVVGQNGCPEPFGQGRGKQFWDGLFKEVGREVNGFSMINGIAWFALAVGGRWTWRKHRQAGLSPATPVLETCHE